MRSMPKPTQALCATAPSAVRQAERLAEVVPVAVARHDRRAVVEITVEPHDQLGLEFSSSWLAASILPTRPKNGSLAGGAGVEPQLTEHVQAVRDPRIPVLLSLFGGADVTYSCIRKACMRAGSIAGSCRKQ